MGDRPESSSRVLTSENKVRRKDLCWSVRTVYVLEKRPDVSGPGLEEAGRYSRHRKTRIFQLKQEEGVIVGDENLKSYITEYYIIKAFLGLLKTIIFR
jgi:hypothetical protein